MSGIFLPVDVMKKQTSHNLNTTFCFLRLSQIQDHFVPTRFTSPRPSAPTSNRTFIRTTGQGRSLLESTLDAALSCSCHTGLAPQPVPSVHLFFPGRQVLFRPVFFRAQSRWSSAVTTGHWMAFSDLSDLHPHRAMPVSQPDWTSTFTRLGSCLLRTCTRPILLSFHSKSGPRTIPWFLCPATPPKYRRSA